MPLSWCQSHINQSENRYPDYVPAAFHSFPGDAPPPDPAISPMPTFAVVCVPASAKIADRCSASACHLRARRRGCTNRFGSPKARSPIFVVLAITGGVSILSALRPLCHHPSGGTASVKAASCCPRQIRSMKAAMRTIYHIFQHSNL